MNVRRATANDITEINRLFLELDKDGVIYQPKHFRIGKRTDEYLLEIINNPKSDFLLAILENEVVGFSLLFEKETNGLSLLIPCKYAYLQDFMVVEKYRNYTYNYKYVPALIKYESHYNPYIRNSVKEILKDLSEAKALYNI